MKYSFSKAGIVAILKVAAWSASAAVLSTLIVAVEQVDIPAQYMFLVPTINVMLYTLKEFVSAKR